LLVLVISHISHHHHHLHQKLAKALLNWCSAATYKELQNTCI